MSYLRNPLPWVLVAATVAVCPPTRAKADDLAKVVELGALGDDFELVSVSRRYKGEDGKETGPLSFELRAKRDVDTASLKVKVGIFSTSNKIEYAAPLVFRIEFPLAKGESVMADYEDGNSRTPKELGRVVFRRQAEPASKK